MPEKQKYELQASFKTRRFRVGSYSVLAAAAVIAIAVVINLIVGKLPAKYTQIDLTDNRLFTISEQTENLLSGLGGKVTVYWIVQSGQEDSYVQKLLDRYDSLSDKLTVVKKDPSAYPGFVSQYTDQTASNNSLIVVCGDKSRYVDYYEIFVTDYSNYYTTGETTTEFDGESALTSAVSFVTSGDLPMAYLLTGHGEAGLDSVTADYVEKDNILTQDLSLLTAGGVPADCACLVIAAPQSDISADEADKIQAYLDGGGRMLLITDYVEGGLPNLEGLMSGYGVTAETGIVLEGDADRCIWNYNYYLLPNIKSHAITDTLTSGGYNVLMPVAQGLVVSGELDESVSVTQLLTTSDSAYSKLAGYAITTYDKEEGDIDGPFALGVAITKTVTSGDDASETAETRIVWYTSSMLMDADVNEMVSGSDYNLLINSLDWMTERENSISIHAKSLSAEALTVSSGAASRLSLVFIGFIPVALTAVGIAVFVRRKRR